LKGSETQFREITSAYEVLGNIKLRRLYDKGFLPPGVSSVHDVDSSVFSEAEKQTSNRPFYEVCVFWCMAAV